MRNDLEHGFQCGAFAVEPLKGSVTGCDRPSRHLPPKAMEVLVCLAGAAPETLTRQELLDKVWGERFVSDEVLTHAITELRHALGDAPNNPAYIETIPKRGYRVLFHSKDLERITQEMAGTEKCRKRQHAAVERYVAIRALLFSFSLAWW